AQQAFALELQQPFWESGDFDARVALFPSEPKLAPKASFGVTFREGRFASRLAVPNNALSVVLSLGLVIGRQSELALMQEGQQSGIVLKVKPSTLGFRVSYRNHTVLGGAVETRLVWGES
ncbi:MAG: hypothetical protein HKN21_00490, partial [Candidatus Eisenbacteria bacterium]|nr:hypothetical protein [Candidatus Eisenbacteria bacterium]